MGRTQRGALAIGVVATLSLIMSVLPTALGYRPNPFVHDEFAYLLQADTFARGRLTNPPHPFWQFFETYHVIQHPTYAAKFPPGQGIALAIGQKLWHPILGAWLSVALGSGLVTWMYLAWLRPGWATVGGILTATSPIVLWWGQSYWGGGVAMIGGAIAAGAVARIAKQPRPTMGVIAGIGAGILAISRPFEGLILCVILSILVAIAAHRSGQFKTLFIRVLPATFAATLPFLAGLSYYNWRVTGNALQLPYTLHRNQYMIAPLMFWQSPNPPPVYRHEIMRRFHVENEYIVYLKQMTAGGFVQGVGEKIVELARNWILPWTLAIPLLVGLALVRSSRAACWSAIACLGLLTLHMLCTPWMRMQYFAPVVGLFFCLAALGLRRLDLFRRNNWPIGRVMVIALVIAHLARGAVWIQNWTTSDKSAFGDYRASVIAELQKHGSRHLVFVQYAPAYPPDVEGVFNRADIDSSDIIFARDMGEAQDRALMQYYSGRTMWMWSFGEQQTVLIKLQTQ